MIRIIIGSKARTYFDDMLWRDYAFIDPTHNEVDSVFVCVWHKISVDFRYQTNTSAHIPVYTFVLCDVLCQ